MTSISQPSHTSLRLKRLAGFNHAKTYLEIGVASGKTFLNVDFPLKHAVDLKFRFEAERFESESVVFFEMASDDFFTKAADRRMKYDVIFLDGLHTFEQTFRDFCASQAHAHDNTLWLIDDVCPSDVFSAHPVQSLAYKYRELDGGTGRAWHGDVYKLIFAIHDFFPNLDFRTFGSRNPQSVVVRRPRENFSPRFGSLELISRLSYFDFLENREVLNLREEEEVLRWLCPQGESTLPPA